ncbi:MAG: hypothetical protein AB1512_06805 [Thermodesulfobacteriota bacterium]
MVRNEKIMRMVRGMLGGMAAVIVAGIATDCRAQEAILRGDKVTIRFTCRLGDGEIAATTDTGIDTDPSMKKSSIFISRKSDDPLVITAGPDEKIYGKPGERGFEGEIVAELAEAVPGMKPGETRSVEIKRERRKPVGNEPALVEMARVRVRPKQVKMTLEEYRSRTGKDPEVGQGYTIDPAIPGKVSSVSEGQVAVRFEAEPGKIVKTPLGDGVIRETERAYEIVIDVKKGSLVRSGGLIGRIVKVDERMVSIDYSHPFGYEALKCEARAESIERGAESRETGEK